jgi:hypothetical protein
VVKSTGTVYSRLPQWNYNVSHHGNYVCIVSNEFYLVCDTGIFNDAGPNFFL